VGPEIKPKYNTHTHKKKNLQMLKVHWTTSHDVNSYSVLIGNKKKKHLDTFRRDAITFSKYFPLVLG
jgi:hypothetical protein